MRGIHTYFTIHTTSHILFSQERRKRTRLMKTASKLTQSELLEAMALQVRMDERRKSKTTEVAEEDEEEEEKDDEE